MQPTLPETSSSSLATWKMVAASSSKTSLTNYQSSIISQKINPQGQHFLTIHKLSLIFPNMKQGLILVHSSQ
jgi:hypothetical protein